MNIMFNRSASNRYVLFAIQQKNKSAPAILMNTTLFTIEPQAPNVESWVSGNGALVCRNMIITLNGEFFSDYMKNNSESVQEIIHLILLFDMLSSGTNILSANIRSSSHAAFDCPTTITILNSQDGSLHGWTLNGVVRPIPVDLQDIIEIHLREVLNFKQIDTSSLVQED